MIPKLSTVATWAGILGGAAAVYFPLRAEFQSIQQTEIQQATQRQRIADDLYHRIGNDEADIAFIKAQLPKDKQDLLDAIWKVRQREMEQIREESYGMSMGHKAIVGSSADVAEEPSLEVAAKPKSSHKVAAKKSPPREKPE